MFIVAERSELAADSDNLLFVDGISQELENNDGPSNYKQSGMIVLSLC